MKLSEYLRGMADKVDKNMFTKTDVIATIKELTKDFQYYPDYIS